MRFPDCKIHHMPQRSETWYDIRKGKLTGSQMGAWLADRKQTTKTFAKARAKATAKIIGQLSSCEVPDEWEVDPDGPPPKSIGLWAIWNGINQEPKAVAAFEFATGLEVEEVGFCEHSSGVIGVSPDGLIKGQNVGFEGKAPIPTTHVEYLLNGTLPETYKAQVHGCMAATGADAWWFQSYCPGLPAFRILVERDEFTEQMVAGMNEFGDYLRAETLRIISLIPEGGEND